MTVTPEAMLAAIGAEVVVRDPVSDLGPRVSLRAFTSAEFTEMKLRPREFILDPILRSRSLAMLSAFRGVGKTHVAMGIAHAVATGGRFLTWNAPTARHVLYVDGEMPSADLQERLRLYPPVTSGFLRVLPMDEQMVDIGLNLSQPTSQSMLETMIGPAALLILDNRSTLVSGGRENDAESWDAMQAWLLRMRRRGVSVLVVEHEGRAGNPRGTSKREDVLDTLVQLKRPADYTPEDGAQFEVHLGKARGVFGAAASPFEAKLAVRMAPRNGLLRDQPMMTSNLSVVCRD